MLSSVRLLICLLLFHYIPRCQILGQVYDGCRNPNVGYKTCNLVRPPKDNTVLVGDPNCTHLHHLKYPFGCYKHACSPENEAFFLGHLVATHILEQTSVTTTPKTDFFFGTQFANINAGALQDIWNSFVLMELVDTSLEVLDPPQNDVSITEQKVPRICDPRAFLYCDSSFLRPLGSDQQRELRSECRCHPLYSIAVKPVQVLDDNFECHGRPGVPCAYKSDAIHLGRSVDVGDSNCMDGTQCTSLNSTELVEYQKGKTFHGFGLSPIMTRYLLQQVTKICKCNLNSARPIPTIMHDCVSPVTDADGTK